MHVTLLLLACACHQCWTIRVPVSWDDAQSEVNAQNDEQFSVESFKPQTGASFDENKKTIPAEYFQYTAKKPQFAVDLATFHGVQSPENHYKAYPIKPFTGRTKPQLGKHHILDSSNNLHKPFQDFTKINEDISQATPVSSSFEVFHPYEAETPALQDIYRDPTLNKIRNDLENSKNRLQQYEKEAGESDIAKDEYLESPQKTDGKLFPHRHRPAPFEVHRPQRRPVYYRPGPIYNNREKYLNHKLRHPWNHNIAKVRPMHYQPVKNHIHHLRQNHAFKYDDERNEYPQVQFSESYSDPKDGYDIYLKGKDKFVQLRNNVDESINKAVEQNHPPATYQKLEIQNNDSLQNDSDDDDEEEFVPIKNYAQVRKTEIFRHLPRVAALDDADTYEEIRNAPRLREAVKSTKAQTVYSEEGYEDGAYDHAGEHKHASENEGHGGFLKEKELSGGKYKTPSISANYEDGKGSTFRDQLIHAEKWKDDNKDNKEETEEEDNSETEYEHLLEADNHESEPQDEDNKDRQKRENLNKNNTLSSFETHSNDTNASVTEHEVNKSETNFEVPDLDLNTTYLTEKEFLKMAKPKVIPKKDNIKQKYPYYFKNLKDISRNSPLRYAENLKFVPKKSKGGTEFYDSRSKFECPEVDDVPDPVPEKIKGDGHPDEGDDNDNDNSSTKGDENFDTTKKQPRLNGLGDKIDCFKAKYFGENPLDSPFFKEDIISNPEPIFLPNIIAYKLKSPIQINQKVARLKPESHNILESTKDNGTSDLFDLIEKIRSDQYLLQNSVLKSRHDLLFTPLEESKNLSYLPASQLSQQKSVYNDVIDNIKHSFVNMTPSNNSSNSSVISILIENNPTNNVTYSSFRNKEDVTKSPSSRKKRSSTFLYEPYKIIRNSQIPDDVKKATGNANPMIRSLYPRLKDRVVNFSPEEAQLVKRNVNTRAYKEISKQDREIKHETSKNSRPEDTEIVDVSEDKRRGEPRYEIIHANHKPRYTPVTKKKSITVQDYEAQLINDRLSTFEPHDKFISRNAYTPAKTRTTGKSYFDISQHIPLPTESQNTAASNTVKKTVPTKQLSSVSTDHAKYNKDEEYSGSDEDYEEDDEEDEQETSTQIATTTTTAKPAFKRRIRLTTTEDPPNYTEKPKLKLITRFRDYKPQEGTQQKRKDNTHLEKPFDNIKDTIGDNASKFREKKKKVTKSTIVTDTKKYGNGDDDMQKEEIDALIGVNKDMDDYVPLYEKNEKKISLEKPLSNESGDNDNDDDEYDDDDDSDDDDANEDLDSDEDEDDERNDEDVEDNSSDEGHDNDDNEEDTSNVPDLITTTAEPTKRTLVITTNAPLPTIASRSAKLQNKPIVTRKKIEIHKELPVNKSSPHFTQFKQDIKEIEIIKETPNVKQANQLKRKHNKNVEVFDLYKDENLANDVNKLGVEIFKENLDLRSGPKHGGNYKSLVPNPVPIHEKLNKHSKNDAEASQSKYNKHIEVDIDTSNRDATQIKHISENKKKTNNRPRNSKLTEISNTHDISMHVGDIRHRGGSQNENGSSQKLIELDDDKDDDFSSDSIEKKSYSRNGRPMHGGNYRSAKISQENQPQSETDIYPRDARRNAALVLNSFVQAAPVLTTTPGYILDPSKRKYYYVDA